jgi:hypothetical protein
MAASLIHASRFSKFACSYIAQYNRAHGAFESVQSTIFQGLAIEPFSVISKGNDIKLDLRGIVYREGDAWIAHCLELDIVAEGANAEDAMNDVLDLCALQIDTAVENNDLESIFRPAPAKYWNLFYSARSKRRLPKASRPRVGRFDAREFVVAE